MRNKIIRILEEAANKIEKEEEVLLSEAKISWFNNSNLGEKDIRVLEISYTATGTGDNIL